MASKRPSAGAVCGVEKAFGDGRAQRARMRRRLARRLDADARASRAPCAVCRKNPGPQPISSRRRRVGRQKPFENFQPVGLRQFDPGLVFAGMGKEVRLFARRNNFRDRSRSSARGIGQRQGMAKTAASRIDDVVALAVAMRATFDAIAIAQCNVSARGDAHACGRPLVVNRFLAMRSLEMVKWNSRARPLFIAEASSNHGRDLARALAFVDAAADAGCDAVKFQLFKIDRMFAPEILAQSAKHRARTEWELPLAHLAPLAEHCSAAEHPVFLHALLSGSGARSWRPLSISTRSRPTNFWSATCSKACAATGKPIVLSTGMATMDEIIAAAAHA